MTERTAEEAWRLAAVSEQLRLRNEELAAMAAQPGHRWVGAPGSWRAPQARVIRWVPPGNILTQYGTETFREEPRFDALPPMVEVEVSMILGRRSVADAARIVTKRPPRPNATVRYFRTDDLYLNGYSVAHTPTERNPGHVSVHYGQLVHIDQVELARAHWSQRGRVTLESLAVRAGEAMP
jgi:hypothetical protein